MNRFGSSCPRRRDASDRRMSVQSSVFALALTFFFLAFTCPAFAQPATPDAPLQFRNAAEEARFHALASELRCVMCQNQSLADSNAQIARDLRGEILQLMRRGQSDAQIEQFLVARYGEFVLYKPRVEASTWLLWFGPALVLLAGAVVVVMIVRRRSRTTVANDETQEW